MKKLRELMYKWHPRFLRVRLHWTDVVHLVLAGIVGTFVALGHVFDIPAAVIAGIYFIYQGLEIESSLAKAKDIFAMFLGPACFVYAVVKALVFFFHLVV